MRRKLARSEARRLRRRVDAPRPVVKLDLERKTQGKGGDDDG
jgi:hypothetical protein